MLCEEISKVRAFALAKGAAVVKWHSEYNDRLHQVYVNGRFAGATVEPMQRQMIVPVPLSQKTAVRIEVFAVEPGSCDIDYFDRQVQTGRAKIEFPRIDNLPMGGKADYYLEGNRLNNRSVRIQPDFADKGGFGLSSFGKSDFGYDGSGAIGLGRGNFGLGWFGFDTDLLCWQSGQLQADRYKFDIKITDSSGNTADEMETEQMTIIPPPTPAARLTIKYFDKQNGKLILQVA
ncbi:MAG: hypothetical protein PHQ00_03170 [Phycisphaerae bacterium]|nr:hypothetical protein [Phycisphaerae bacterium]